MKSKLLIIASLATVTFLSSCKKDKNDDPSPEVENEVITTVQLVFKDSLNNTETTYKWENLDGYGTSSTTTIDTIKLNASSTYLANVILLNKTNPAAIDTISNEVLELNNEHQFFYEHDSSLNIESEYIATDVDDHGVPVGLNPKFKTGLDSKGNLSVILKHQPGVKPTTGKGDKNLGSTDINVSFPVVIKTVLSK